MNFFLLFINIEELLSYKNIAKTLKLYDRLLDPRVAITTFFNSEKCIQFLKCEKCVDVPLIWNFLLSFLRSGKQSLCMTFPCFHNDISYSREVIIFPCLLWFILGFFLRVWCRPHAILGKVILGMARSSLFLSTYCASAWLESLSLHAMLCIPFIFLVVVLQVVRFISFPAFSCF